MLTQPNRLQPRVEVVSLPTNFFFLGPIRIPPFGTLIQNGLKHKITYVPLYKMAKEYGDIMSIKLGIKETGKETTTEVQNHFFSTSDF